MAPRFARLVVEIGLILGAARPSPAAAAVRPPTSQEIAHSSVPARGAGPANARSYFGARYYRAGLGRFTTVDPAYTLEENLEDPQRWNRYAYVRNNPPRFIDPDGREPWEPAGHTDLTASALGKFTAADREAIIAANLAVDRPQNQFNDAAHAMPGSEAATRQLISERRETAVRSELAGRHADAMRALGEGTHTVEDRFAHEAQGAGWRAHAPLVGSAPDDPGRHPQEYAQARQAAQNYVKSYEELLAQRRMEQVQGVRGRQ